MLTSNLPRFSGVRWVTHQKGQNGDPHPLRYGLYYGSPLGRDIQQHPERHGISRFAQFASAIVPGKIPQSGVMLVITGPAKSMSPEEQIALANRSRVFVTRHGDYESPNYPNNCWGYTRKRGIKES